jgi:hypothetical protein
VHDISIVDDGVKRLESISASAEQAATLAVNADAIRMLRKRAGNDIIEIGRRLAESREIIRQTYGHGHWLKWLEAEFSWTDRTALNLIRVFERFGESENFSDLDLPNSALYLLVAPSTPKTVCTKILDRAKTEKMSVADVKEAIADQKRKEEAIADFKRQARRLGMRMHEKAVKEHLQKENRQVAQYLKAAKDFEVAHAHYLKAATDFTHAIKVAHACIERFTDPVAKQFVKRRHKQIIARLEAFEKELSNA